MVFSKHDKSISRTCKREGKNEENSKGTLNYVMFTEQLQQNITLVKMDQDFEVNSFHS